MFLRYQETSIEKLKEQVSIPAKGWDLIAQDCGNSVELSARLIDQDQNEDVEV
jgi:hypothetical protein